MQHEPLPMWLARCSPPTLRYRSAAFVIGDVLQGRTHARMPPSAEEVITKKLICAAAGISGIFDFWFQFGKLTNHPQSQVSATCILWMDLT